MHLVEKHTVYKYLMAEKAPNFSKIPQEEEHSAIIWNYMVASSSASGGKTPLPLFLLCALWRPGTLTVIRLMCENLGGRSEVTAVGNKTKYMITFWSQ